MAGWGLLEDGGARSKVLMELELEVIWMKQCRNNYRYRKQDISPRMLCTFKKKADACQGDSGGPLIYYNEDKNRYEQVTLTMAHILWHVIITSNNAHTLLSLIHI